MRVAFIRLIVSFNSHLAYTTQEEEKEKKKVIGKSHLVIGPFISVRFRFFSVSFPLFFVWHDSLEFGSLFNWCKQGTHWNDNNTKYSLPIMCMCVCTHFIDFSFGLWCSLLSILFYNIFFRFHLSIRICSQFRLCSISNTSIVKIVGYLVLSVSFLCFHILFIFIYWLRMPSI